MRRGSKVSILKLGRERSHASSRRSRRAQDMANAEKTQEATTPSTPEMSGPPKPQQKRSKLLSFLACCGSTDVTDVDGEDVQPAKKTAMRPTSSNRLSTPDKAEAQAGDSSTAESRDPAYINDEKAPLAPSADQARPPDGDQIHAPADAQDEGTAAATSSAQPELPPVSSKDHEGAAVAANGSISELQMDGARQTDEQPAAPDGSTGTDPTAPIPVSDAADKLSREEEGIQTPAVLPPPPPPPPPPAAPEIPRQLEAGEQEWLLPPPLPHLQNRKCLVLDLDETLVHSSFKVSRRGDVGVWTCRLTLMCRFSNVPTSPSPLRSKGNTTTFT